MIFFFFFLLLVFFFLFHPFFLHFLILLLFFPLPLCTLSLFFHNSLYHNVASSFSFHFSSCFCKEKRSRRIDYRNKILILWFHAVIGRKGLSGLSSKIFPIVFFQFVPFRDFQTHGILAPDLLTKEVLAEVPDQLLSYMTTNAIKPKPPQPISVDSIMPIMPHSANQTAPFATNPSSPYPVNPSAPPFPANHSIPVNQGAPYPTN